MLKIEVTNGAGGEEKIDYISRNANSLFYSNPRFIRLIEDHLDATSRWLIAKRDDETVGMLPFIVKGGVYGPVFNSLAYYGSNGGVIQHSSDDEAKALMINTFFEEARLDNAASATIITNPLEKDFLFYESKIDNYFLDQRVSLITHFPEIENDIDLIAHFQNPRPRNIRRAIKEGVVVEKHHDKDALQFLYKIHVENMNAIGGLPKKKSFFYAIPECMEKNDWAVFVATKEGVPIAALLLFYFNKTVEYFTPVIIEEFRSTQALALTIYEAMKDSLLDGYKNWNWGGTWLSQGGVYDFKKRWGTTEYSYFYYTKIYEDDVINSTPAILQDSYPGLFVVPYKYLKKFM